MPALTIGEVAEIVRSSTEVLTPGTPGARAISASFLRSASVHAYDAGENCFAAGGENAFDIEDYDAAGCLLSELADAIARCDGCKEREAEVGRLCYTCDHDRQTEGAR